MRKETFDVKKACDAQSEYCKAHEYPHFAPGDGRCYDCGKNIYQQIIKGDWSSGYSVERASSELITGCPHCYHSYCD
jgi:hypothetical protein